MEFLIKDNLEAFLINEILIEGALIKGNLVIKGIPIIIDIQIIIDILIKESIRVNFVMDFMVEDFTNWGICH
jgi:hypothetical protein